MKTPFEAYGIECHDGWKGLYQPLIDLCNLYGVEILQVKEKFGGLRFYIAGERAIDLDLLVDAAEAQSFHTCELCGEHGVKGWDPETRRPIFRATTSGGWRKTLCEPCREKKDKQERRIRPCDDSTSTD